MRVNERFEMLEDKIRQLEKEVFELKTAAGAVKVPDKDAAAVYEETNAEEAGTAKKARTTRAKKTSTK